MNVLSVKENVNISFVACSGEEITLIVRPTISIQDLTDHQSYGYEFSGIDDNVNEVEMMNNTLTLLWILIENKEKFSDSKAEFMKCIMPKSFAKIFESFLPIIKDSFLDTSTSEKEKEKEKTKDKKK